jgi:hypothetical protein
MKKAFIKLDEDSAEENSIKILINVDGGWLGKGQHFCVGVKMRCDFSWYRKIG